MDLAEVVDDVVDALVTIDASRQPFKEFQPGVGPYGEPQLVKLIAAHLNRIPKYKGAACVRRSPDLLIPQEWAIEFKLARPFGDNNKEAENWSVNLLHPYPGNVSTIGDCYKLLKYEGPERGAVAVIGYEHTPPKIQLTPLIQSFEEIAKNVLGFKLSDRIEVGRDNLVHPVHQAVRVFAWELLDGPRNLQSES
ncbi:MAG: hypothetical protein LAN36_13230 [Acidobacteriia bacterium]|nr:hypothetical protein [Terriglobia bacterium]